MSSKIIIYSANNCPFCKRAIQYLTSHGYQFTELDLTGNYEKIDELKRSTGHRTIPLIFVNDQFIGGYTDLMEKINSKELILVK